MISSSHRITLILATRNLHKVAEIRGILSDRFEYQTLNDFPGAPAVVEDAPTFAGNAAKKAEQLAQWILEKDRVPKPGLSRSETYVLADDSGLEVDALGGAPGVHSARFAALDAQSSPGRWNSPDAANNAKLLRLLENVPSDRRSARFHCVLALVEVCPHVPPAVELFAAVCEGRISNSPSGHGGFGYDPLFVPTGYDQSFADLGEAVKNTISHRAKALGKLKDWLAKKQLGSH